MQQNLLAPKELDRILKNREVKTTFDLNDLVGEITKYVVEGLLKGELSDFLGYSKYERKEKATGSSNSRNGFTRKEVKSKFGPLEVAIPRDRESRFEPQLIKKGQSDISFFEDTVLALYANGLSTRQISSFVKDIYGHEVSPETISTITDKILEEAIQWQNRQLQRLYAVLYLDALYLKIRMEGSVQDVPVYVILGITLEGRKECLGLWIDSGSKSESSKHWLTVMNELKNRGVDDVLVFCVDNLSGISKSIKAVYPKGEIQKCIVHQVRNSLRFVARKYMKEVVKDLKAIYKAATEASALAALDAFEKKWKHRYPNIAKSWRCNWAELSTFFKYPEKIRQLIYTTNPIESINRVFRRLTRNKSAFPGESSAFKVLYLAIEQMREKWTRRLAAWSEIYPQLLIFFEERVERYI